MTVQPQSYAEPEGDTAFSSVGRTQILGLLPVAQLFGLPLGKLQPTD